MPDAPEYAFTGQWFGLKAEFQREQVHSDAEADALRVRFEHELILRLSVTFPPDKGFSIAVNSKAGVGCYEQEGSVLIGSFLPAASVVLGALAGGTLIRDNLKIIAQEHFGNDTIRRLKVRTGDPVKASQGERVARPSDDDIQSFEDEHLSRPRGESPLLLPQPWRSILAAIQLLVVIVLLPLLTVRSCEETNVARQEARLLREQLQRIEDQTKMEPVPPVSVTCAPSTPPRVYVTCPAPAPSR